MPTEYRAAIPRFITLPSIRQFLTSLPNYIDPLNRFNPVNAASLRTLPSNLVTSISEWAAVDWQDGNSLMTAFRRTAADALNAYGTSRITISDTLRDRLSAFDGCAGSLNLYAGEDGTWTLDFNFATTSITNDMRQFYNAIITSGATGFGEWFGMIIQDCL